MRQSSTKGYAEGYSAAMKKEKRVYNVKVKEKVIGKDKMRGLTNAMCQIYIYVR